MTTTFTPLAGLAGGILIGLAAVVLMGLLGRIAGVSGIVAGLLKPFGDDAIWRAAFVLGLIGGASVLRLQGWAETPVISTSWPILIVGGFLVGLGTRIGGGCTSGHGVCGIARLSTRSIIATAIFLSVAMAEVYLIRHVLGWTP